MHSNYKHEQRKQFLLVGDKFMPELHLWNPKVKGYSACFPFTKHEQRIIQFMNDGRFTFAKISLIKLAFNMIWPTTSIKI